MADHRRETTRAHLARTSLRLFAAATLLVLLVLVLQRPLGLTAETVKALLGILLSLAGLVTIVFRFYFR